MLSKTVGASAGPLARWLGLAIAAHFGAEWLPLQRAGDFPGLYLPILAYAIPASAGLRRAGVLGRTSATAFCAVIAVAHALAVWIVLRLWFATGGWSLVVGGAVGAAISLGSLALLRRAWDERIALIIIGAIVVLAATSLAFWLPEDEFGAHLGWPYLIWQTAFSLAVLLITRIDGAPQVQPKI